MIKNNYYQIYKKYNKIISKIDYKIDNINNDITFKKKVLCDLKKYEVKKRI